MENNEIQVYGRSDDLIEIEGAVREEFYANYGEPTFIEITPGYVVKVRSDSNGDWRLTVVEEPDATNYEHFDVGEYNEYGDYSEVLCINHPGVEYEVTKRD